MTKDKAPCQQAGRVRSKGQRGENFRISRSSYLDFENGSFYNKSLQAFDQRKIDSTDYSIRNVSVRGKEAPFSKKTRGFVGVDEADCGYQKSIFKYHHQFEHELNSALSKAFGIPSFDAEMVFYNGQLYGKTKLPNATMGEYKIGDIFEECSDYNYLFSSDAWISRQSLSASIMNIGKNGINAVKARLLGILPYNDYDYAIDRKGILFIADVALT